MKRNDISSDKPTVLVVDDSAECIKILNEILHEDYRVLFSKDPENCIDLIETHSPDIVLLDINMPDIDGFHICQSIKGNPFTRDTPVIFITDKDAIENREAAFKLGCNDFMTKPVSPYEVKMRVYNQLRLKRNEELIMQRALYDHLTGLPNRLLSLDRLRYAISHDIRMSKVTGVIFVDVDKFKNINDTMGHDIGDKLLISIANRFKNALRKDDTIGRLGGDEFLIVIPGLNNAEDAKHVVSKIRRAVTEPIFIDNKEFRVTVSMGLSLCPYDSEDYNQLLSNADMAMYQAKRDGRNGFHLFTQEMNENIHRKMQLENHLHRAIDNGELSVYYQPLANIKSSIVTGAEALLRWHSPVLGAVEPKEIFPLIEQNPLIHEIGKFVLETACKELGPIRNSFGEPIDIAINISPQQLRSPDFIPFIEKTIKKYHIQPSRLELEVTETVMLSHRIDIFNVLEKLRSFGIRLSLDDFGTGYSSLSYLLKYNFDILKIDRSFVESLGKNKQHDALVSAVISLAESLDLHVIAEGVESNEQLLELDRKGCETIQGFLISPAVPLDQFIEILNRKENVKPKNIKRIKQA
ncbi:EAL domain-containing protein [Parasalinivibrio latis]|uniref:two-component system response regulator n=1 Tax=Parasalinivibrio latis TaxID=2952610 RepID=UPI0030E43409